MNALELAGQQFVADCVDDCTGLWVLYRRVQDAMPGRSPAEYRLWTLDVLGLILSRGQVKVGDLSMEQGFQPWTGSQKEIIERIRRSLDELGHDPTLGDIAWFVVPE